MLFRTVGIVGVGLIGTSLGMALRRRALAVRVIGVDVDESALAIAKERGAIDEGTRSFEQLRDSDLVVVAVPPDAVVDTAVRAAGAMRAGGILTDVASIKGSIVRRLEQRLPRGVRYVGAHPMAGSEGQGAAAADPTLLEGRTFVLTPTKRSDPDAVATLTHLAQGLGMRPVVLSPDDHDELVAQISHLPYLVAVAAASAASDQALDVQGPAFSALARVAGSPVDLWTQICQENRDAIRRALARFREELDRLDRALEDRQALQTLLEPARRRAAKSGY